MHPQFEAAGVRHRFHRVDAPPRSPEGADPSQDRDWEEHVHRYYNATPYWGI